MGGTMRTRLAALGMMVTAATIVGWGVTGSAVVPIDEPVTFTKQIAPIIFSNCGGCHRPGGPGPFSLLTYAAVRQRATQIAAVTKNRFMPPWKSEPGYGDFIGQRHLTDAQLELIQRWVADGAPEGSPNDLPPLPHWDEGWQLG